MQKAYPVPAMRRLVPPFGSVLVAALILLSSPAAAQGPSPSEDVVRVRVLSATSPSDVRVWGDGQPLAVRVEGREWDRVSGPVRLRRSGAEVDVSGAGVSARGRSVTVSGPVRVQSGRHERSYRGDLHVAVDGRVLLLVNHVAMNDYVASVVASEYPFTEIEGVKAQAILARTYALRRRGTFAAYDLDDHQGSQVYKGRAVETAHSRRAAAETAGEVLLYGGDLAEAVYFSSSGGHTADNESVWSGAPVPYLRGVADPYDADAPDHTWRTSVSRSALHRALSRRFGGRVQDVRVGRQSREGRVLTVQLVGAERGTITGSEFRDAANDAAGPRTVRSTRFELAASGDRYVFDGRGFGHGVGMSQYGARGQAREGRSYREILAYYFQGTDLGTATAGGPLVASTRTAAPESVTREAVRRWPAARPPVRQASDRRPARERTPAETTTPQPRRKGW